MPGERFEQAAARNVKRELGLTISHKRFSYLGTYSLAWAKRRQEPQENGVHDVSITMVLIVNEKEASAIKPNKEYKKLKWWNPVLAAKDQKLFPPVRQYARDILAKRKKKFPLSRSSAGLPAEARYGGRRRGVLIAL